MHERGCEAPGNSLINTKKIEQVVAQSLIAIMLNAMKLIYFLYTFSKFKSDTPLNKMGML